VAPRKQVRLEGLGIAKVSGVDDPANLQPGWAVMKGAEADPEAAALLEAIGVAGAGVDALASSLTKAAILASLTPTQTAAALDLVGAVIQAEEAVDKAALSGTARDDLPDSDFAYIEPGGTKDSSGKTQPRSKRHFPIPDAAHVRNALARIEQGAEFGEQAEDKVNAAAKRLGIGDDDMAKAARLGVLHKAQELLGAPPTDPMKEDGHMPEFDKSKLSKEAAAAFDEIEKAKADAETKAKTAEDALAKANEDLAKAKEPVKPEPAEDPIAKATKDNPELAAILKAKDDAIAKAAADATEALAKAKVEHDARVDGEYIAKAAKINQGTAFAKAWRAVAEQAPDALAIFEEMAKALDESRDVLTKSIGGDGETPDEDAGDKLTRLAKELAQTSGESYLKSYAKVLESDEGKKLYAEYDAAQRKAG
jgi:hypothetical protein